MPWCWIYNHYILEGKKLCQRSPSFKPLKAELLILVVVVIVVNWRCPCTAGSKRLCAVWFPTADRTVSIKSPTMWPTRRRERWHLPAGEGGTAARRERNVTRRDPSWKFKRWLLAGEVPGLRNKRAAPQFPSRWESPSILFMLVRSLRTPDNSWLNFRWLYRGSFSAVLFSFLGRWIARKHSLQKWLLGFRT